MFTIDNIMSVTLGERIKALREARGWSLRQLGARAGVSGAYIHQLETGVRQRPNIELVARLANALDLSIGELTGEQERHGIRENGATYTPAIEDDPYGEVLATLRALRATGTDKEILDLVEELVRGIQGLDEESRTHVRNQIKLLARRQQRG